MARHHMHVQMKHHLSAGMLAELLHGDAVGLERRHRSARYFLGDTRDMGEILRIDIEDVAGRRLRDHQGMPGATRHDVEKGQRVLVLVHLVTGKFAAQDFCKGVVGVIGVHGGSWIWFYSLAGSSALLRNGPASVSSRAASAT